MASDGAFSGSNLIQIQHLLKLNLVSNATGRQTLGIQIQHLLKLNINYC